MPDFNVSMVDGRRAYPSLGAYQTTARGLEGFSEALAAEVALRGIRVTIALVVLMRFQRVTWRRTVGTSLSEDDHGQE